eukprot:GHVS01088198.1.p1 GENE.GHVS01088198.1~~GHVS01088198.1.p1  ORF type:complete len:101 (-),score=12.25 GHVS01088198.1:2-304(-)
MDEHNEQETKREDEEELYQPRITTTTGIEPLTPASAGGRSATLSRSAMATSMAAASASSATNVVRSTMEGGNSGDYEPQVEQQCSVTFWIRRLYRRVRCQ